MIGKFIFLLVYFVGIMTLTRKILKLPPAGPAMYVLWAVMCVMFSSVDHFAGETMKNSNSAWWLITIAEILFFARMVGLAREYDAGWFRRRTAKKDNKDVTDS